MIKKIFSLFFVSAVLFGCNKAQAPVEPVSVFAAASLTESMKEIAQVYEQETGVPIILTLDSSGTLKKQIESGAPCDLFISAAQKQMNALQGEIISDTRINLLENKVVLATPQGNPAQVHAFTDLAKSSIDKIAIGNDDVPVGQYAKELLKNINLWDSLQTKLTLGSNVKEVTVWIKEGTVSAGIIYATDASAAKLPVVATADTSILKTQVHYPAAVLKNAKNKDGARAFLAFLKNNAKAQAIFTKAGFTPLQ